MIYVFGPRDKLPKDMPVINVTSRSRDFGRELSPFFLGPCDLYDDYIAQRMENAWQYSKVYASQVDEAGEPTEKYWRWARLGWMSHRAERYPMGKGAKPLYSLWNGEKLTYVEARKKVYVPLYRSCVLKTEAWKKLQEMAKGTFGMWDFDGYNHHALGMTLEQVSNSETRKMGHAFVLAMMLNEYVSSLS